MRSKAESTKFVTVSYEADPPRRRDFWRVLLGRWRPQVRRVRRFTIAGVDRELKEVWAGPMMEQMMAASPLFDMLERDDPSAT